MTNFINRFIESPSAIVAILSFVIAYVTYLYQKNQSRKQRAQQIAEWYAKILIPKSRYIRIILEEIGNSIYYNRFVDLKHFTSSELEENLKHTNCTTIEFMDNFNNIDENVLDKAFSTSGCNEVIYQYHNILREAISKNPNDKKIIFNNFVIDFLNEIEGVIIQFSCNLADEKMVYPILHQSFLKDIKYWYYFISQKNLLDHNRYYPNIIALYVLWNERAVKAKNHYYEIIIQETKQKKL